jgi:hypothetical protein
MREPIADSVIAKLSVHLGPHVAKMAVRSFAKKAGIAGQEQLTAAHLPGLIADIRPMLNVMIGKGPSESVVADIERLRGRQ